jgi:hypothetical protein
LQDFAQDTEQDGGLVGADAFLLEAVEKEFIGSAERAFSLREKLRENSPTFSSFFIFFLVNHRKFSRSNILNVLLNCCIY